jgi:hypothetical protein
VNRAGGALLCILCAILPSCRDIQPFQTSLTTRGYQLNGTVTSANGIPLDSVGVRLYYSYDVVGYDPVDTQQVIVTDSTRIVDVSVYTPNLQFVRQLYFNYRPTGPVPHFLWDERDQNGVPVSSGEYLIRYAIDSLIVKYSIVVIDGHTTATTDAFGRFVIPNANLPVGTVFDAYNLDNTYDVTLRVKPEVDLILYKAGLLAPYSAIQLKKDQITTAGFTLG